MTADEYAGLFQAHYAKGEHAPAAAALEAALHLRPDWTDARYNLGGVLAELGRLPQAEAAYRQVIAADPGRLLACRMLGSVLHRQGRIEELLKMLAEARRRHPEDFDLESFELVALMFSDGISADELFARHRAFGARLESAIAVRAARAPDLPAALRATLRQRMRSSPLMDEAQFVRDVEAAYRAMAYS